MQRYFTKALKRVPAPLLLLAAVEILSFGPFILHRGFYADDWIFLHIMFQAEGFISALRSLVEAGFLARPVEIFHYPIFYALGLSHPALDQALLLLLKVAEGWLLFRLLDRLLAWRDLALCAALLALTYPNRSATHLWLANSPQSISLILALGSLLLHEDWIRTRRTARLAGSMACYLVAVLSYESVAFTPLLLGAGLAARAVLAGTPIRAALFRASRELSAYAAAFALAVLWMWGGPLLIFGTANPKPLVFSLKIAWDVYSSGFAALGRDTLWLCARSAPLALRYFPWYFIAGWTAVFAAALFLKNAPEPGGGVRRRSLIGALAVAFAAFLAGYAPYVFSRHPYISDVVGIMNRLNAVGAWSGGLVLAALLAVLFRSRPVLRRVGLVAILGAFAWTNSFACLQWAVAWETSRRILVRIVPRARDLPPGAMIILMGAPRRFGGAPVFTESWDFDYALKMTTGRPDLSGRVAGERMRFEKDFVAESPGAAHWPRVEDWRYPYDALYAYRYDRDRLERLEGPPLP